MPYILRDEAGKIRGLSASDNYGALTEFLADDDADVIAFRNPSAPIPNITKRQALLFLFDLGKSEADVLAAINSIPDATQKAAALITWNYPDNGELKRSDPLFDQLGPLLGIPTSADMDAAFMAASKR